MCLSLMLCATSCRVGRYVCECIVMLSKGGGGGGGVNAWRAKEGDKQ